ncbi:MAG: endonuclease/exonuclease/phosphatase family protein [Flavobacteriaceae bacterium]|nr:endonuclease/exonuclease/phosphatase family protein [Flavobacteriaceae bacterium]
MIKRILFSMILMVNIITLIFQLASMGKWIHFDFLWFSPLLCPLISIINLIFLLYWIIRAKWPFLLFLFVFFFTLDKWSLLLQLPDGEPNNQEGLKVMSYNVRLFNQFNWIDDQQIPEKIQAQINSMDPDVVCLQEYSVELAPDFSNYPHQYFESTVTNGNLGNIILSKAPILESGKVEFENSNSGGVFADIEIENRRFRFFSVHFESLSANFKETITDWQSHFNEFKELKKVLEIQNKQVELIDSVARSTQYPVILCMDLNNNAFSDSYQQLTQNRKDAFVQQGIGIGTTYNGLIFPMRIDFIIVSESIDVLDFRTSKVKLSDHRPIMAVLAN